MKKLILLFIFSAISNFAFAQFPNLVASSNSPVCSGNTLNLSAAHDALLGGTTAAYSWTGPNNFTSNVQNPQRLNANAVDGTYTVTLTLSGTQTGTYTATTSVLAYPTPIATVTSYLQGDNLNPSNNFCAGNNITLEATTDYTSGVSYSWTGPNGFSSTLQAPSITNVTAANAGNYQVTITFNNSSCVFISKRSYEITIGSPRVSISQNLVCSGGNVTLTPVLFPASATVSSYLWEGNSGFTSNASTLTINNLQERKTYKLTAVFGGGCSGTSVAYISPQPIVPTPSVTTSLFNCNAKVIASMPTTFTPANLTNYSWTGPSGFSSNQLSATVSQAGDYTFTGTISGAGCNDVFTRTVTVPRIPSTTNPIINVSLLSTSEFTGGSTPSAQTSFCDGIDVILLATIGGDLYNTISYNWTGPNGFSSTLATPKIPNFSAAKAGIYYLTITGTGNACNPTATATVSNSLFIGHNTAPSISSISFSNLNAPGTVFCSGSTVSMTPNLNTANSNNSFGTYSWTGPNGFSSTQRVPRINNVSAANEGVYSVTATFTSGCVGTATSSVTMSLSTQPSFSVLLRRLKFNNATVTSNCLGSTVELIAQTSGSIINSISWTGPNGFSSNALSPQIVNATAANSGYYYATIDMGGECPATITRAANLSFSNANLPFSFGRVNTDPASDNRSVCLGNNIKIYAVPTSNNYYQATYSWAGPNGFTSNDIAPTISNIDASKLGTYTMTATYTDGCVGTSTAGIAINTNPLTVGIGTVGASAFCNGSPVSFSPTLALTNIDSYSWTGPNGFTSTQQRAIIPSVSAANIGIYTLTINIGGSCPATVTATTNLAYETAPATATIRFTEQTTNFQGNNQCAGANLILSLANLVTSQITSYSWTGPGGFSSTLANPLVTNATAGTYTVSIGYLVCGVINTVTGTASLTNTKSMTLLARNQGGASASSYCTGSNVELLVSTVNPTYAQPNSYTWSGPNGFSSTASVPLISNVTTTNGGVYTLTANFGSPCAGTVTATINITIADFQASLFARRQGQTTTAFTFCSGTTIELYTNTPSSGTITSYNWTGPNGFSSTAASPQIANFQAANAGSYSMTVVVSGGACAGTYTATTNLLVGNPVHSISTSTASVQCSGGNITLFPSLTNQSYGTGTTYSWSGPNGFSSTVSSPSINNLQPINSGVYTITINYPFTSGCAASGTVTNTTKLAIGNTAANILAGQDQTVNANTNFPLNIELLGGTLPISITLSNGISFNVSSVNGNLGNIYTLNTSLSSSQTLSISSITSSCGVGTGTGSAVITVNQPCPTTTTALSRIQGSGTSSNTFCTGTNVELYSTFNSNPVGTTYSYSWTGPNGYSSTSATPLFSNIQPSNSGTYSVTVTFGGSCTGTASSTRTITVANTALNIYGKRVGSPTIAFGFCNGSDVDLVTTFNPTVPTVNSYSWTGPNGFSSTANVPQIANFQAINNGTYSLTAVVTGECAGTYTATVNLSSTNTITPSIGLSTFSVQCPGGAITFFPQTNTGDFSNNTTYSWSGPNSFSSTSKNPVLTNLQAANSGIYTVTIVHSSTHGCANFTGTTTLTKTLSIGNTAANILPNQNQTVAANTNFTLNIEILGGTFPMTLNLSNGSSFGVPSTISNTGNIFTANLTVPSAQTITISSLTSSCPSGTNTGSAVISIGTPCPPTLTNYSLTVNNGITQYKEASGIITTQTVTVNSGGKLTLDSGKSILLQPGFEAKTGSVFKAHIDGCGGITN